MLKIRASSLSKIMTEPKSKNELLSAGAKSYLDDLAKQQIYGYREITSSKYLEKGTVVETQSIALYNTVFFTSLQKNTERRENDFITGECDIFLGNKIIDIKSSWSISTFPALVEDGESKDYEWQLRAYMWLWNVECAEIAYCLVDTPEELIGYEDPALHFVSHIDPHLRVTIVPYQRDLELEKKIEEKVKAARDYYASVFEKIQAEHDYFSEHSLTG